MAKDSFMPRTDSGKQLWLENIAAKLPLYAEKYGITQDEIEDKQKGSLYFTYWLNSRNQNGTYLKKMTQFKNELCYGVPAGSTASIEPAPPTLAAAPASVPPGLFKRASSLGLVIKKKSNYTVADGNDLGLEGVELVADMQALKPILTLRLVDGGKPQIQWKKKGTDGLEIYVDRGDGNWVFLAVNTTPNYTDTTALPSGTTNALWKYKAIYRFNDVHVGQWSDVTAITVS